MTPSDWVGPLTDVFLRTVDRLADDDIAAPSRLPGWSRAHTIAHVHANAEALLRLTNWARTGEETPMYESRERRDRDIEELAARPADVLRSAVRDSASRLDSEFADLTDNELARPVRTAMGRVIPAREIAWMRCREVGVHAVDLDAGTTFEDLPDDFLRALIEEVVDRRLASGEHAALAAWLTGRVDRTSEPTPWL